MNTPHNPDRQPRVRASEPAQEKHVIDNETLKAIYPEGDGATREADADAPAEWQTLRDNMTEWTSQPLAVETHDRMRGALLGSARAASHTQAEPAAKITADLVPVNGHVWFRRPGSSALVPCSSIQYLQADSDIVVPSGSRAQVHYGDGSLLLLDSGTELRVLPGVARGDGKADDFVEKASLSSGRLYAWVARQHSGRFAIGTPQGRVSVLGTEFDLEATAEKDMRLVVTSGRVRFARTGAGEDSYGAASSVTLDPGQSIEVASVKSSKARAEALQVRTLSLRELARHTSWSRGGGTRTGHRMRGYAGVRLLLLALAMGGLFCGYTWYRENAAAPSTAHALAGSSGTVAAPSASSATPAANQTGASPGAVISPTLDRGKALLRFVNEAKRGNEYVKMFDVTATELVHPPEPDGSRLVEVTLKGGEEYGPNGAKDVADMPDPKLGTTVLYTVQPDGRITSIDVPGEAGTISHRWARTMAMMARQSATPRVPVQPGTAPQPAQEWQSQSAFSLSEVPGSKISFSSRIRYEGPDTDSAGRRLDRYSYALTTSFGGFEMRRESRNGRELILTERERIGNETGTLLADAATGELVRREATIDSVSHNTRTTRGTNGRGQVQELKPDSDSTRLVMTREVVK